MTTYLNAKDVPATLKQGYQGQKIKVRVCAEMTIPRTAGLWSGGSRDTFSIVRIADGAKLPPFDQGMSPWDKERNDLVVALEPGIAVIEHSIFCGKDMGLTIYAHPDNAAPLLPKPVELDRVEALVLKATSSFKSSYMGRDRYDMACRDWCYESKEERFPTRVAWEEAKTRLIERKLLNKAGAITVEGRNALNGKE